MDFNGKVALITGASVGIGRAAAMRFAELGADLVLADINFEKLQSVKAELAHYGRDVLIYPCDVSDESRVNEITAYAMTHFGKVDILVNNAALWRNWSKFEETPIELWKKFLNVNVMSVVYFTNAVLPKMKEQNYGRIINVCSVAGVYGNANMACYSATKAAVIGMSKALAKEVAKQGITVNAASVPPRTLIPTSISRANSRSWAEPVRTWKMPISSAFLQATRRRTYPRRTSRSTDAERNSNARGISNASNYSKNGKQSGHAPLCLFILRRKRRAGSAKIPRRFFPLFYIENY